MSAKKTTKPNLKEDFVSEDDWAAAMNAKGLKRTAPSRKPNKNGAKKSVITGAIPVALTAVLGRTQLTLDDVSKLRHGSVVTLDELAGEPMELQVNGTMVAKGEVVVVNERFGIRITDIV